MRLGAGLEVGLDDVQVQDQVGGYIVGGHMVARMREEDVFQCQRLTSNYVRDSAYQDGAGGLLQGDTDGHTNEVGHDVVCECDDVAATRAIISLGQTPEPRVSLIPIAVTSAISMLRVILKCFHF